MGAYFELFRNDASVGIVTKAGRGSDIIIPRSIWPVHDDASTLKCAKELERLLVDEFSVPRSKITEVFAAAGLDHLNAALFEDMMKGGEDDAGERMPGVLE